MLHQLAVAATGQKADARVRLTDELDAIDGGRVLLYDLYLLEIVLRVVYLYQIVLRPGDE